MHKYFLEEVFLLDVESPGYSIEQLLSVSLFSSPYLLVLVLVLRARTSELDPQGCALCKSTKVLIVARMDYKMCVGSVEWG